MLTRLRLDRLAPLALLVGGALLVYGCGESATGERPQRIAFVTNQVADFWNIARAGAEDAERELNEAGYNIRVSVRFPSEGTATVQQDVVEDLMAAGLDGLAISPVDAENQRDLLNRVAERVTLITHDSDAPDTDRLMYIGMDNYEAGRMCGKLVKEALPDGGTVALFIGRLEQDNARRRRQGVIDELLDRSHDPSRFDAVEETIVGDDYTILETRTDQGQSATALANAEDVLARNPDIGAMVGLFEYNPPAIYTALQAAGKLGEVAMVGFDENEVTLQAIQDGHCIGTVVQHPYEYGYQSVEVLARLLAGEPPDEVIPEDRFVDIPARTITAENVNAYWADLRALTGN